MFRLARSSLVLFGATVAFACAGKSGGGHPSGSDGGAASSSGGDAAPGAGGSTPGGARGGTAGSASHSGGAGGSGENGSGRGGDFGSGGSETDAGGSGESAGAGVGGSEPNSGGTPSAGGAGAGGSPIAGTGGAGGEASSTPPCDIYAEAGVPCVGAYSMVRVLSSTYAGPLYQVRKGGPAPNLGEGGETMDVAATAEGFGDAAAQDAFCGDETCTVSILYDQSGKENHLRAGAQSCYLGSASPRAYEADARRRPLKVGGHDVYALFTQSWEGYRNNDAVDTPEGEEEQGVYVLADGTRAGETCCWDFGTGTRTDCYGDRGSTKALFLGIGYWGSGQGDGPWFMADLEAGVWAGGMEGSEWVNPDSPAMNVPYAFGILKTGPQNYTLRMGDGSIGDLTTAWDGGLPIERWSVEGGIILGMASDVSNLSAGVFYEGAITAGRPSDETDEAVHRSIQAVGYGR